MRLFYRSLGTFAVMLALAGIPLPGLPTTPFLLIALWAFARGSPEWAERLRRHPRLGPYIRDWEERRAIPRRAKGAAVAGMAASWGGFALVTQDVLIVGGLGVVLAGVVVYVVTRPSA